MRSSTQARSKDESNPNLSRLAKDAAEHVMDLFRAWGYLEAELDPLGRLSRESHPELQIEGEVADRARSYYCGPIGVEFMHVPELECRQWIQERMESDPSETDPDRIVHSLLRAEVFEQYVHARYLGSKRFSLEGVAAMIPLLDEILEGCAESSLEQVVLAMTHRGRLNVIFNTVGRTAVEIFAGFEDVNPRDTLGGGDVKYHLGATGRYASRDGRKVAIHLVSNPSHLEAVSPVAVGRVRAKQIRIGQEGKEKVVPVVLHGDAAFAGQGILAETLNLTELEGFLVGGTIHVIVNNLIGFTAEPRALHSSRFASDVAKRIPAPIFHVNAADPDAVVRVARMALEYRHTFRSDVIIDLIGYRRHGHSEVDDPTITQHRLYQIIQKRPPLWQSYAEKRNLDREKLDEEAEEFRSNLDEARREASKIQQTPVLRTLPKYWDPYEGGRYDPEFELDTAISVKEIEKLGRKLTGVPKSFNVHPKVQRLLDQRREMAHGDRPVDFAMAEALAFASLVASGHPVRLTGQDSRRGTFSQRHSVLIDIETGKEHVPLKNIASDQASFESYDSMLSEAAVLGFEYGYSRDYPEALVLWEAQFGDFANGAQVIIDQFISSGEDKWDLLSGVVLLLPHGYEGQGPEHSSARIERFLQLAAEDNFQVCQPSMASQYFHLLRRQALRKWRKPLVVFTPKSMLRHPSAASHREELSNGRFRNVIGDPEVDSPRRVLVCSGKIGHELRAERKRLDRMDTAIVFLEQFYPFPKEDLAEEFKRYDSAREIVWVQEEPANMGGLFFLLPELERLSRGRPVRSVKRSASASPATGSARAHGLEQETLLNLALSAPPSK